MHLKYIFSHIISICYEYVHILKGTNINLATLYPRNSLSTNVLTHSLFWHIELLHVQDCSVLIAFSFFKIIE